MTWPKDERLIYCRREFKKGLTIARKVASRNVVCCCRDKARAYRSREKRSREMSFVVVGMKKGLTIA